MLLSLVLLLLLCLLRLLLSVVATCLQENKENYAETIFLQSAAGTSLFSVVMLQTWPKFGQNLKALVEREISSRVRSGQKPVECDCRQAPRGSLKRSASVASLRKSASSSSLPSALSEGDNHDMVPGAEASVPADADTSESQIVVHGKRLAVELSFCLRLPACCLVVRIRECRLIERNFVCEEKKTQNLNLPKFS